MPGSVLEEVRSQEALACPHAPDPPPAGPVPARTAHVGTPGTQSYLPRPLETSGCWGGLSQVATAGDAMPPLTSRLTPGRGPDPGPPCVTSAGKLSPNPASRAEGEDSHSGEAGDQGRGAHLVSCSIHLRACVSISRVWRGSGGLKEAVASAWPELTWSPGAASPLCGPWVGAW